MVSSKRRGATSVKSKHVTADTHVLLARGLSARFSGVNIPINGLTSEEMERDLRHIEAFSNACVAYSQQYFIYRNQNDLSDKDGTSARAGNSMTSQPLVAMPVRIDPEEEKRLATLRQKIQHTESQREVMESQYLSLRAHFVYISQVLKKLRGNVTEQLKFLQSLLQKRGDLVSLQRARLQMARDTLDCLRYRRAVVAESAGNADAAAAAKLASDVNRTSSTDADDGSENNADSMSVDEGGDASKQSSTNHLLKKWNAVESSFKRAEEACHEGGDNDVMTWSALKVPKTPPGVPLLLSQLSTDPGYGAAYACKGMFGSAPHDLCWLVDNIADYSETAGKLEGLRAESEQIRNELEGERNTNRDLQNKIIACRKHNDEMVATMTFLRTETEAVVRRHNILLESKEGKEAALSVHKKEEAVMLKAGKDNGSATKKEIVSGKDEKVAEKPKVEKPVETKPDKPAAESTKPIESSDTSSSSKDAGKSATDDDNAKTPVTADTTKDASPKVDASKSDAADTVAAILSSISNNAAAAALSESTSEAKEPAKSSAGADIKPAEQSTTTTDGNNKGQAGTDNAVNKDDDDEEEEGEVVDDAERPNPEGAGQGPEKRSLADAVDGAGSDEADPMKKRRKV